MPAVRLPMLAMEAKRFWNMPVMAFTREPNADTNEKLVEVE